MHLSQICKVTWRCTFIEDYPCHNAAKQHQCQSWSFLHPPKLKFSKISNHLYLPWEIVMLLHDSLELKPVRHLVLLGEVLCSWLIEHWGNILHDSSGLQYDSLLISRMTSKPSAMTSQSYLPDQNTKPVCMVVPALIRSSQTQGGHQRLNDSEPTESYDQAAPSFLLTVRVVR